MLKPEFIMPVKFMYVPPSGRRSKAVTLNVSTDLHYRTGLQNPNEKALVIQALRLIRKTGLHERIATPEDSFPSQLRVVYSLSNFPFADEIPNIDISPIEGKLMCSCIGNLNRSTREYPEPRVIEARPDGVDLSYDFVDVTLRYEEADEIELLKSNGAIVRRQEWQL